MSNSKSENKAKDSTKKSTKVETKLEPVAKTKVAHGDNYYIAGKIAGTIED